MPTTSADLGLSTPTKVADEAIAYATEHLADHILQHSLRTYRYVAPTTREAGLIAGEDFDDELVFLICVLHDLGMSEIEDPSQRFELDGADLARRFLLDRGVAPERAEVVWTAIALHTNPGIAPRFSPESAVAQMAIFSDGTGPAAATPDEIAAIERAHPRLQTTYRFVDALVDRVRRHPGSATPMDFGGHIRALAEIPGEGINLYDMLTAFDTGDRPAHRLPTAERPEDLAPLFATRFNSGDLDSLLALFETEDDVRAALTTWITQDTKLTIHPGAEISRQGRGLALLVQSVEIPGRPAVVSTEVVRRQPDGRWLYAIGHPLAAPA